MKILVQGADLRGRFQLRDATVDALAERYRSDRRVYFSTSFEQERRHRPDCFMITADELLVDPRGHRGYCSATLHVDPARTDLLQRALGRTQGGAARLTTSRSRRTKHGTCAGSTSRPSSPAS